MKLAIPLLLFISVPRILYISLKNGINRKGFALLVSVLIGVTNFILSIMFVEHDPIIIGGFMFTVSLIGAYPISYLSYPGLRKRICRELE